MLEATLLALGSAGLHATWNFLVKTGADRDLVAWGQFCFGALLAWPLLIVIGPPGIDAVPYLVASGAVHAVYVTALVTAYHHGDFSLAYPLARGSGALVAALGGVLFLDDRLAGAAWLSIGVVLLGILGLVGRRVEPPAVGWALATGLTIGTYTTIDAAGARAGNAVAYGLSLMSFAAVALTITGVARGRGPALVQSLRFEWRRYAVAGAAVTVAYTMVLAAVQLAPVGYVATLRESSVVIGALIGWLVLHERLGARRVAASAVMAVGLAMLVLTR